MLAQFPGATIFTAGDNIDHLGTPKEFKNCFGTTWGVYKDRIHPAIGDMEYNMKNPPAYAYFDYFGAAAGPAQRPAGSAKSEHMFVGGGRLRATTHGPRRPLQRRSFGGSGNAGYNCPTSPRACEPC